MKTRQIFTYFLAGILGLLAFNACVDNDDYATLPVPPKELYMETFDSIQRTLPTYATGNTLSKVNGAVGYDDSLVVYSSSPTNPNGTNGGDIRIVSSVKSGNPFVWIPYNSGTAVSFVIDNLSEYTKEKTNLSLIYRFNDGAVYDPGTTSNANKLILKLDDAEYPVPDIPITTANGRNMYIDVYIPIPDDIGSSLNKIEFINPTSNGFRLDDIKLVDNYQPIK